MNEVEGQRQGPIRGRGEHEEAPEGVCLLGVGPLSGARGRGEDGQDALSSAYTPQRRARQ